MTSEIALVPVTERPHPARLSKSLYPVSGLALARYGDMDANGHVNNLALESMHENARAEFNERIFPGIYDPAVRTIRPARIETGLGIGRLGRTSYVVSTALFVGEDCVGLCDTVLVMLGDDGPLPVPEDARARLGDYLLG